MQLDFINLILFVIYDMIVLLCVFWKQLEAKNVFPGEYVWKKQMIFQTEHTNLKVRHVFLDQQQDNS